MMISRWIYRGSSKLWESFNIMVYFPVSIFCSYARIKEGEIKKLFYWGEFMKKNIWIFIIVLLSLIVPFLFITACKDTPDSEETMPLDNTDPGGEQGVPSNGFPNWNERMILVYTNRARSDPQAMLAGAPNIADAACYSPVPPVQWNDSLNKAARFHAFNLTSSGCGMSHDSPCALIASIGADYPTTRDGSVASACVGGVANCGDVNNDDLFARMGKFGIFSGARGENIASSGIPLTVINMWLLETTADDTCEFTWENGHRWNIFNTNYTRMGSGATGSYTVQDFWENGVLDQNIPSGGHSPQAGGAGTEFRVNWYDSSGAAPSATKINIDGQLYDMILECGSNGNATYLYTFDITGESWYYFRFRNSGGTIVSYPGSGSFGVGTAEDWKDTRP